MAAQERRGRSALVGAAIIAALLAAAILIFSLDDILRGRRATVQLVGVFPDAAGVHTGTPVWLAGAAVGEVLSVSFLPPRAGREGTVALRLELPAVLAPQVRADSDLWVGPAQLLGLPVVRIEPGSPGAAPLRPGDTLRARPPREFGPVVARLPALREQADTLLDHVDAVTTAARAQAPRARAALRRLDAAAVEARRLERLLEQGPLVAALGEEGLRRDVRRLMARLDTLRSELGAFGPAGVDSAAWSASRRSLGERLAVLRAEQARLDSLVSGPYGTLGRLQTDTALARAAAETRAALDSLFSELRSAPWRLFF